MDQLYLIMCCMGGDSLSSRQVDQMQAHPMMRSMKLPQQEQGRSLGLRCGGRALTGLEVWGSSFLDINPPSSLIAFSGRV